MASRCAWPDGMRHGGSRQGKGREGRRQRGGEERTLSPAARTAPEAREKDTLMAGGAARILAAYDEGSCAATIHAVAARRATYCSRQRTVSGRAPVGASHEHHAEAMRSDS